jgi:hypothetical protein
MAQCCDGAGNKKQSSTAGISGRRVIAQRWLMMMTTKDNYRKRVDSPGSGQRWRRLGGCGSSVDETKRRNDRTGSRDRNVSPQLAMRGTGKERFWLLALARRRAVRPGETSKSRQGRVVKLEQKLWLLCKGLGGGVEWTLVPLIG